MRRTMAVGSVITALAALGIGTLVGPVGAGIVPRPLVVSPDPAHRGDIVTIGNGVGGECDGDFAEFEVFFGTDIITEQRFIQPDADGNWSRTIEIAPDAALGIYEVEAECLGEGEPESVLLPAPFEYEEKDFEVIADEEPPSDDFTFTVSPGSGLPGSTVSVAGAFCSPGLGDAVVVTFTAPTPNPTWDPTDDPAGVFTVGPPDASYAGTFPVPAVAPGDYQVNGFCVGEGGSAILEPISVPFEVLAQAQPPKPVVTPPSFTG